MVILILIHSSGSWKIFQGDGIMSKDVMKVHEQNVQRLKNFLDDPYSEDKLKLQILRWLWDNLGKINANDPKTLNPKFHEEMQTFLALIEMRS